MELVEYKIAEIAELVKTGKTPTTSRIEYFEGDVNWYTPSDLKGNKFLSEAERKLSYLAIKEGAAFLFKKDTVLISTIGEIGRAGILLEDAASNQQLTGVFVNENVINKELFYYWILRNRVILDNKANRSVIAMLSNKLLNRISIKFPINLSDQSLIVSQLNKLDEIITKRKLVAELLDKFIISLFIEQFGDPYTNPKKHSLNKLKDIVNEDKIITYGIVQPGPHISDGVYYIQSGDIKDNSIQVDRLQKTSPEIANNYDRSKCTTGDIVMSMRATVGSVAILPEELNGANLARGTARISVNDSIANKYFVYSLFLTEGGKARIIQKSKGTTFKEISLAKLREIEIPIPPIDHQNKYAEIYLKIKSIQSLLKKSIRLSSTLFESTLQKSFDEGVKINEDDYFQDILKNLKASDLKIGRRLQILIEWLNKDNQRFSELNKYDTGYKVLIELLDDNSVEQIFQKGKIKLRVKK